MIRKRPLTANNWRKYLEKETHDHLTKQQRMRMLYGYCEANLDITNALKAMLKQDQTDEKFRQSIVEFCANREKFESSVANNLHIVDPPPKRLL